MPKTYYCWRCKMPIPMLTDEEWQEVRPLLQMDIARIKEYRTETGACLQDAIAELQHTACQRYFEITGFTETNPNALWHHYLSKLGPECDSCGQLLRTPQASFCASCGARRDVKPEQNPVPGGS